MDMIRFAIFHDWLVLLPIVLCSVLTVAVTLERLWFYHRQKRGTEKFLRAFQRELGGGLGAAKALCSRWGGILAEVAEEGIGILVERRGRFEPSFDIACTLATRRLEAGLAILGSIATISPYLGLFGTVIRILLTFGEMAQTGGGAGVPQIMFGIGSALIATAFGLGVAIAAVALNNYFRTVVGRFEDDFQLLKLLFLSVPDAHAEMAQSAAARTYALQRQRQTTERP